jgi:SAM-dependent methyltransferase
MAGERRLTPGLVEYVALRVARRFLFTDAMLKRMGGIVPYYRTNANEVDARPVVALYERAFERSGRRLPANAVIVEVGSGATNSVGYALAQSRVLGSGGDIVLFEPFAALDAAADARQRAALPAAVTQRVRRVTSLAEVESGSADLIVSHSVLEHVSDPASVLAELDRVMTPSGVMLHAVDYRDHFFKYPFHFLLFSGRSWDRWLNPGDLPRWRLGDHLQQLEARGLRAEVLDSETLPGEFAKVAARVHPDFDRDDPRVAVAQATILVTRGA